MVSLNCLRNQVRGLATSVESPLKYAHLFNPKLTPPKQAWVETFVGQQHKLLQIVDLHPTVFAVFPRIDQITKIVKWQMKYREVNYVCMPTRGELPGGTRRPWPQKGTGRARHSSVNSPIFYRGGWAHGPRGPTTNFILKPHHQLVNAMRQMLSIKLAQDDLKVVDSIDTFQSDKPEDLETALAERNWGPSALIVDRPGIFSENLSKVCAEIPHINLMHTVSLNTLSLCKHETLIITLDALKEIEEKLLFQLMRVDLSNVKVSYRSDD